METVTVFTSTYNRGYCLNQCYTSLLRQTCKDFLWLIIDDGSTDNTRELVGVWQSKDNGFKIQYIYKQNEGLFSGYTTAFKHIRTELCVSVDSDDYLTDDAIEQIINCWKKKGSSAYAGIIGLDCLSNGDVIGDRFPNQATINPIDLLIGKYRLKNGDRKFIVRTELYKMVVPFDSVPGEKDFNPEYLHLQIGKQYDFIVLNLPLCIVNYQPDGMTQNVFKHYYRSPNSYRIMRQLDLSLPGGTWLFYAKKTIHYISSCILSKSPCISGTPHKIMAFILYPVGVFFTIIVVMKNKRFKKAGTRHL